MFRREFAEFSKGLDLRKSGRVSLSTLNVWMFGSRTTVKKVRNSLTWFSHKKQQKAIVETKKKRGETKAARRDGAHRRPNLTDRLALDRDRYEREGTVEGEASRRRRTSKGGLGLALAATCAFYVVFASPSQDKLSGI